MRRTGFTPEQHGFHFANTFVNRIGPVQTHGLCGGMCLAAARYRRHRRPIPPQRVLPADNSPLRGYIFDCQMESYGPLGLISAANWVTMPGITFDDQFRWSVDEFNRLRPRIDQGEPVVLGLRNRQQGNPFAHQVLATGYDVSPCRVFVYDPNYPDKRYSITLDESRRRLVYGPEAGGNGNADRWASFFICGCSIGDQPPPLRTTVSGH
jgi:hypothetical protein